MFNKGTVSLKHKKMGGNTLPRGFKSEKDKHTFSTKFTFIK